MDIKKLLELKAKKKQLDPIDKEAKTSVVKGLQRAAEELMGEKLNGLKKVTVASNDKEGLEKGLDKAKDMLSKHDPESEGEKLEEETGMDLDSDNEQGESEEHQEAVLGESEYSEQELDAKLAELMKQKEALKAKKV